MYCKLSNYGGNMCHNVYFCFSDFMFQVSAEVSGEVAGVTSCDTSIETPVEFHKLIPSSDE